MHPSLLSQFDLSGKAAIVTGASRGLGVSFARGLAKAGCNLIITARDLNRLQHGGAATSSNMAEKSSLKGRRVPGEGYREPWCERVIRNSARLDILVNNAGISAVAEAEAMSSDAMAERHRHQSDRLVLLRAECRPPHAALRLGQNHQHRVDVWHQRFQLRFSGFLRCQQGRGAGLTRELAVEWAPRGLHVVALAPGFFRSDQTIWAFEQDKELGNKLLAKVPMARMGKLEELEAHDRLPGVAGVRLHERPGAHPRRRFPFLVSA